jgi:hypothetical protein
MRRFWLLDGASMAQVVPWVTHATISTLAEQKIFDNRSINQI